MTHAARETGADRVWTFDRLVEGTSFAPYVDHITEDMADRFATIYGQGGEQPQPNSAMFATLLTMRAYLNRVTPRPRGNIHRNLAIRLMGEVAVGEPVRTEFRCAGSSMRNERQYVDFVGTGFDEAGRKLFEADLTMIWAPSAPGE